MFRPKKVFRKFWLSDCYQLIVLHQAAKPESNPLNRYLDISLHNFKPQQTKLSIWPKQFQQNFIFWGFNLPLPCCKIWKKFLEQILRNSLKWKSLQTNAHRHTDTQRDTHVYTDKPRTICLSIYLVQKKNFGEISFT